MSRWYDQHQSDITDVHLAYDAGEISETEAVRRLWLLGFDMDLAVYELHGYQDDSDLRAL